MKFEFGDLYKFVVSAGLALATVAVLLFWLLLKEPFDLRLSEADIKTFSATAQEALRQRQSVVASLMCHARWAIPLAVFLGFVISGWGLVRWRKLQHMADAHAEIDLEVKRAAVRPKIEDEVAGKDSEEEFEAGSDRQPVVPRSVPTGAGRAEKKLADRLQELLPRYTVDYEMMVGTTSVDIILRSGTRLDRDYLLELKIIRKGFNAGWLKQVALTLRSAALVYQQAVGRRPNTCVVVGVDDVAWDSQKYADVRRRVLDALPQSTGKHHIAIMSLSELELLDARVARTQLGLPV